MSDDQDPQDVPQGHAATETPATRGSVSHEDPATTGTGPGPGASTSGGTGAGSRGVGAGRRARGKSVRGFAAMNPEQQRAIARLGGRAAHRKGVAHEFTSQEAREAGRIGGHNSHLRKREMRERQQAQGEVGTPAQGAGRS